MFWARRKARLRTSAYNTKEFSSLKEDANVYRLVGPVLLKQDTAEAKSTVDSRLGYIDQEMYAHSQRPRTCWTSRDLANSCHSKRIEQKIKESQEKSEGKKMEVSLIPAVIMRKPFTNLPVDNSHPILDAAGTDCCGCLEDTRLPQASFKLRHSHTLLLSTHRGIALIPANFLDIVSD